MKFTESELSYLDKSFLQIISAISKNDEVALIYYSMRLIEKIKEVGADTNDYFYSFSPESRRETFVAHRAELLSLENKDKIESLCQCVMDNKFSTPQISQNERYTILDNIEAGLHLSMKTIGLCQLNAHWELSDGLYQPLRFPPPAMYDKTLQTFVEYTAFTNNQRLKYHHDINKILAHKTSSLANQTLWLADQTPSLEDQVPSLKKQVLKDFADDMGILHDSMHITVCKCDREERADILDFYQNVAKRKITSTFLAVKDHRSNYAMRTIQKIALGFLSIVTLGLALFSIKVREKLFHDEPKSKKLIIESAESTADSVGRYRMIR